MHVFHTKESGVGMIHDSDYDGSCCTNKFYNLIKDMDIGANTFNHFITLSLWDVNLGKNHDEMKLMILEYGLMYFLDDRLVIISSTLFHGGVSI